MKAAVLYFFMKAAAILNLSPTDEAGTKIATLHIYGWIGYYNVLMTWMEYAKLFDEAEEGLVFAMLDRFVSRVSFRLRQLSYI